jgi:hypothetical protein
MMFLKNIETTVEWINLNLLATRVMDSIGFNNLFYNFFLFNYIIKINDIKIEHQP